MSNRDGPNPVSRDKWGEPIYADADITSADFEATISTRTVAPKDTNSTAAINPGHLSAMADQSLHSVTTSHQKWTYGELLDLLRILKPCPPTSTAAVLTIKADPKQPQPPRTAGTRMKQSKAERKAKNAEWTRRWRERKKEQQS